MACRWFSFTVLFPIFTVALIILLLPLAACAHPPAEDMTTSLHQQQQRWSAAQIQHYRYQLQVDCFCPFSGVLVEIEVNSGEESVVRNVATGELITDTFFNPYRSLDQLFTELKRELDRTDGQLATSEYDETYGFPTYFKIVYAAPGSDEDISYTIQNFEVLE